MVESKKKKSAKKTKPPEERGRGSVDKYAALRMIHELVRPGVYLEIGVQHGASMKVALDAGCPGCIGVDPAPDIPPKLFSTRDRGRVLIVRMPSNDFFRKHAHELSANPPYMVFIDGMHLVENALSDFNNVERWLRPGGVVVLDDIFPAHPLQAERVRATKRWTGDVWKLAAILRKHRPDLRLTFLDVSPTGLLVVTGLSIPGCWPYNLLWEDWFKDIPVPQEVLDRAWVRERDVAAALRAALSVGES